ncbi:hypothetical protein Sgly_1359 [Syntrophobotulus glycolicus DSM 8271]|uniref:Uncharacterized protein n=1 Tax=Syntrophobotulus glycolicus (strain DSM 8271 / FlGlyR) TaxID=645991 RepID=F0SVV8_SYNGF|nr:hypothetical protein [Syntrophobotulus glycolicus]ADY55664.1 hypothetical protein Sgly_1359 [Syntrophobotulus glycolicus DSM 8271]
MRRFEEINLPTEEEKNHSIQTILANGMPEPQRLFEVLSKLWRSVGFRGLFFGVADCAFLGILIGGLLWAGLFSLWVNNKSSLYVLLFLASPLLYALLHILTIWKEIMTGTYEQKMACRYSSKQITSLRMLAFGGSSAVLSVLVSTLIWLILTKDLSILRLMGVSFASLFLFAAVQLLTEWKRSTAKSYFLTPVLWVILSGSLLLIGRPAEQIFLNTPTAVFWLVTAGSGAVYGRTLKHYYFSRWEGALTHVVC